MTYIKQILAASALAGALAAAPATAAVTVLDFEGIGSNQPVGNFYAPDFTFSPDTLASVDLDAGGTGNFANEPSPNTTMYFLNSNNAILNANYGFDTGFSFFYSSAAAATVNVWDGLDATGNLLASINLVAQHSDNCSGDPNGAYCNWTAVGVNFAGTAYSIDFGGAADQTGYDNITFGSATPDPGAVPEPSSWALLLLGFGAIGGAIRSRKRANAKLHFA